MKIGIVTSALVAGGAQRVIVQLIQSWVNDKNEIILVLLEKKEKFFSVPKEVKLYEIGRQSNNSLLDKVGRYSKVRKILNSENVDVILSLPEEIGIYVIPSMFFTHIPVIVSERNNPWVMPNKKITRMLRKVFYPFASGVIFQTKGAASFFSRRIQEKGIILPNPLDISRLPDPYHGERRKIIVGAGRLERQKNFSLLIEAFSDFYKKNKDYELHIFGNGSMKQDLTELSDKLLPKGKVKLLGNNPDLLNTIKDCAIFILSSDYEGVPNVLIEAMSIGMPVISTDCAPGGARELIVNNENGLLIETNNRTQLALAIEKLVNNKNLAEKLSQNAPKIKINLASDNVARKWLSYLKHIAGKKNEIEK